MPNLELAIPEEAPVMVLSNALLFPHVLLPLHIFEPRYRAMLKWALEHDRVFCIALRKPDTMDMGEPDEFFQIAGLGLIRACVGAEDGTSNLMLQGLTRVRFTSFTQTNTFFIAKIEPLPPTGMVNEGKVALDEELLRLAEEIRVMCRRLPDHGITLPDNVDAFLTKMEDPSILADSVAHAFLRDPLRRQQLLEETNVHDRLIALSSHLRAELNL